MVWALYFWRKAMSQERDATMLLKELLEVIKAHRAVDAEVSHEALKQAIKEFIEDKQLLSFDIIFESIGGMERTLSALSLNSSDQVLLSSVVDHALVLGALIEISATPRQEYLFSPNSDGSVSQNIKAIDAEMSKIIEDRDGRTIEHQYLGEAKEIIQESMDNRTLAFVKVNCEKNNYSQAVEFLKQNPRCIFKTATIGNEQNTVFNILIKAGKIEEVRQLLPLITGANLYRGEEKLGESLKFMLTELPPTSDNNIAIQNLLKQHLRQTEAGAKIVKMAVIKVDYHNKNVDGLSKMFEQKKVDGTQVEQSLINANFNAFMNAFSMNTEKNFTPLNIFIDAGRMDDIKNLLAVMKLEYSPHRQQEVLTKMLRYMLQNKLPPARNANDDLDTQNKLTGQESIKEELIKELIKLDEVSTFKLLETMKNEQKLETLQQAYQDKKYDVVSTALARNPELYYSLKSHELKENYDHPLNIFIKNYDLKAVKTLFQNLYSHKNFNEILSNSFTFITYAKMDPPQTEAQKKALGEMLYLIITQNPQLTEDKTKKNQVNQYIEKYLKNTEYADKILREIKPKQVEEVKKPGFFEKLMSFISGDTKFDNNASLKESPMESVQVPSQAQTINELEEKFKKAQAVEKPQERINAFFNLSKDISQASDENTNHLNAFNTQLNTLREKLIESINTTSNEIKTNVEKNPTIIQGVPQVKAAKEVVAEARKNRESELSSTDKPPINRPNP